MVDQNPDKIEQKNIKNNKRQRERKNCKKKAKTNKINKNRYMFLPMQCREGISDKFYLPI